MLLLTEKLQGKKWSSQCQPRPFYSQPRQLPCAWQVMNMPSHLSLSYPFGGINLLSKWIVLTDNMQPKSNDHQMCHWCWIQVQWMRFLLTFLTARLYKHTHTHTLWLTYILTHNGGGRGWRGDCWKERIWLMRSIKSVFRSNLPWLATIAAMVCLSQNSLFPDDWILNESNTGGAVIYKGLSPVFLL